MANVRQRRSVDVRKAWQHRMEVKKCIRKHPSQHKFRTCVRYVIRPEALKSSYDAIEEVIFDSSGIIFANSMNVRYITLLEKRHPYGDFPVESFAINIKRRSIRTRCMLCAKFRVLTFANLRTHKHTYTVGRRLSAVCFARVSRSGTMLI